MCVSVCVCVCARVCVCVCARVCVCVCRTVAKRLKHLTGNREVPGSSRASAPASTWPSIRSLSSARPRVP